MKTVSDFRLKQKLPLITANEMWTAVKGEDNWGIQGYEVPRFYFDSQKEHAKKLHETALEREYKNKRGPKRVWPPKDWPLKDEVRQKPKRPNYLDAIYKWCNSFNDEEKSKELREQFKEKHKPHEPPKPRNRREEFIKREKQIQEDKLTYGKIPDEKQDIIDKTKEKFDEIAKEMGNADKKLKDHYRKCPQSPRCDRVTILADAEYCGEQVPFYQTFYKEDEDKSAKKALFFPNKTCTWKREPKWKFAPRGFKDKPMTEDTMEARKELEKERMTEITEKILDKQKLKSLNVDVQGAYDKVKKRGNILITMKKPYKETQEFAEKPHKIFSNIIGPDQYWKMPKQTFRIRNKTKETYETKEDSDGNKIYIMDRKVTDRRLYKPLNTTVY